MTLKDQGLHHDEVEFIGHTKKAKKTGERKDGDYLKYNPSLLFPPNPIMHQIFDSKNFHSKKLTTEDQSQALKERQREER